MNNYVKTYMGSNNKKSIPLFAKIFLGIAAFTAIAHVITFFSESFADFVNLKIGAVFRFVLANITDIVPFSVAEALIILLPIIVFLLIRNAAKTYSDSWNSVFRYFLSLLSVLSLFYTLFFWCFGAGYRSPSLEEKLSLERKRVSAEELYETAMILSAEAEKAASEVRFRNADFSVMPYDINTLSDKLNNDFARFSKNNSFLSKLRSNIKPVMLSKAMSYTHITGVYTYFTGEANINVNFPDYTIPFTAAHELAHQRGVAREDEANFVAFLVCKQSDEPYIRYSAYMNMLDYLLNALFVADQDLYTAIIRDMNDNLIYEIIAYAGFFDKYADSLAGSVSGAVNDTFLKLNGTEGEKSYGMVVDLAVAYYKNK